MQQGTRVADDTGELVLTGRKQRRREAEAESIATSRSGLTKPQAFEHYLLCLQLVLRKQIFFLIHERRFPVEYEVCFHLQSSRLLADQYLACFARPMGSVY